MKPEKKPGSSKTSGQRPKGPATKISKPQGSPPPPKPIPAEAKTRKTASPPAAEKKRATKNVAPATPPIALERPTKAPLKSAEKVIPKSAAKRDEPRTPESARPAAVPPPVPAAT